MTHVKTAAYLRISSDRTGEELGVTRQREDVHALLAARGWPLLVEHVDNDLSAAGKIRRPGFEALLADIEAGRVQAVAAWSLDRLTRNRRDTVRLIETCQRAGATVALVRGSDIDMSAPSGRLTADILCSVARHEIEQKADRQTRAARQAAELGRPPGGPVPFGYQPDRLTPHPEQAQAIRSAYAAILAGSTLTAIARRWNAAGLTSGRLRTSRYGTGTPSQWVPETVRKVLLHPRNAGLREYKGAVVGPSTAEPIVDEATYYAVREILTDPARRHAAPSPRRLLSGIAVCGVCGRPILAGSNQWRPHYRCSSRGHVARRSDHADGFIAGGEIEGEQVRGLVVERLSRPDAVDLLPQRDGVDVGALRDRVSTLRRRIEDVAVEFADDESITPGQLRAMTGRLREKLAAAEAELAEAGRTSVLAPLVTGEDVAAVWRALDTHQQRAVIDTLMTVTLHPTGQGRRRFDPSTIEIGWRAAVV